MRITHPLAIALLALTIAACSGVETRPAPTEQFAKGNYKYYQWRSEPLDNRTRSGDRIYLMDPIVRRELDANLRSKGYILDPSRAQFSVDYLQAPGLRIGEKSGDGQQHLTLSQRGSQPPDRRGQRGQCACPGWRERDQ